MSSWKLYVKSTDPQLLQKKIAYSRNPQLLQMNPKKPSTFAKNPFFWASSQNFTTLARVTVTVRWNYKVKEIH